jgi:uncharacterized protein YndB with AHSA1/START domain
VTGELTLVVRRTIGATAERLFSAWTEPAQLRAWWGPSGVRCIAAEVDLRIGGAFRIGNELPDGRVLWIAGTFEQIEPPHRLVYSWQMGEEAASRVTVQFIAAGADTEVIVTHERIRDAATRDDHERGWIGCLDGLAAWAR